MAALPLVQGTMLNVPRGFAPEVVEVPRQDGMHVSADHERVKLHLVLARLRLRQ